MNNENSTQTPITGRIALDSVGHVHCGNILLPHPFSAYEGSACTITRYAENLHADDTPEYPYYCVCPESINVKIVGFITQGQDEKLICGKYVLPDTDLSLVGNRIQITLIKPILKKDSEFWGVVREYDILAKESCCISDFQYVKDAHYNKIYGYLENAMKYYDSDPMVCCEKFRCVFNCCVNKAETIAGIRPRKGSSRLKRVKFLCRFLKDRELMDDELSKLFLATKTTADVYHHPEDRSPKLPPLVPSKDRYDLYCGIQTILKWLVALPNAICAYKDKRSAEKARLKMQKEKQEAFEKAEKARLDAIKKQERGERLAKLPWILGGLTLIGALVALFHKKKS